MHAILCDRKLELTAIDIQDLHNSKQVSRRDQWGNSVHVSLA